MFTGEQIKKKRKQLRMTVEELAVILGTKPDNIYKWERGGKPQTGEMDRKIEDWLAGRLENVPHETEKGQISPISKNEGEDTHLGDPPKNAQELTTEALLNLTFSDKARATAEKDRAAAELIREENNRKIIEHLTAASPPKRSLDEIAKASEFLELIAEIGSGKKVFGTKSEGLARLSKFVPVPNNHNIKKGTHDGSHK